MKKGLIFKSSFLSFLLIPFMSGCSGSNECVVKFVNYDGTVLQEEKLKKGDEVTYKNNRPAHFDDSSSYYKFKGWDKEIEPAKGDTTYTAEFDAYPLANVPENPDSYVETLPSATKDGNILQAFCWTYNDVKKQLPYIRDAGFKTVQISPVQVPKSSGSSWWAFYQPLAFRIADGDESPLGTKAELEAMCSEAESYGISIIADIVFNHMANLSSDDYESDYTPKVSPNVETYEPEIYAHRNDATNPTFHHILPTSGCGQETQRYSTPSQDHPYDGLPDLNTSNMLVQERAYSLLKECIDVGIDGFRFDAAKHIETPDDPEYASDFWPNTLGQAKTYYHTLTGKDLFAYGEVLGAPTGRKIDVYAKLMNVTEGSYCDSIERGVLGTSAQTIKNGSYGQTTAVTNMVSWLESHDSYLGESTLSNSFIGREWAVLANRKDSTCMFLARPEVIKNQSGGQDNATVGVIYDYFFRDEAVGAVNRFHNRFIGADESEGVDGSIYYNERYSSSDKGAIVLDTKKSGKVIVEFAHLGTDVYYDQLTGKKVVVRDGHATVELNKEGIAILTKSNNEPRPTFEIDDRGGLFTDSKSVKVEYNKYVTEATYKINDGPAIAFESGNPITFSKAQAVGDSVKLTITVKNPQYTCTEDFYYQCVELVPGYFNIVNVNPSRLDTENFTLYMWSWGSGAGKWSKEFTTSGNKILIADSVMATKEGVIIAVFPGKNYEVTDVNKWDNNVISQTTDIVGSIIEQGYYDGSRL